MCGIAGAAWTTEGEPLSPETLARMVAVLTHRGPDDEGTYFSRSGVNESSTGPAAALGHRRLSIIDIAGGHQPLANEDHTVWIVFNGEIYNFEQVRGELESRRHRFRSRSDTETIVHLYEEYGADCLQHLRGMFAFALWDDRRGRLLLARDRLGQKPLYYRQESDRLLFASELKSLLQLPDASAKLNHRAVDAFLTYQYVPDPACILDGYCKLPPGHLAMWSNGTLEVRRYWSPPFDLSVRDVRGDGVTQRADAEGEHSGRLRSRLADAKHRSWSPQQWCEELRQVLTEAVKLRMRSDVPLGAFLSGGIDSTIITGLMQRLSETPVHTFSIGFPVRRFDESSYAKEAADFLGTRHHEFVVEPSALEMLPMLIWHYDEPFADSSAIPTMALSRMTRQEVTVALSGDGGDELFAGYDRYRAVRLAAKFDRLPRPLKAMATSRLWQKLPASVEQKSFARRLKRFLAALGEPPEQRYLTWIAIFNAQRRAELYSGGFRESLGGADAADYLLGAYAGCPERDIVTRTTCADVLTYLPGDILTKVDRASMAYGLECRSPFLDHHVAELAAAMPMELKLRGRQGKRILRETFGELIPPSILKRPKMGFGVPLDHWFRKELKPLLYDVVLSSTALSRGVFRPEAVRQLVKEHISRKWDHSYRLWSLLVLEMWQQAFLDSSPAREL